MFEPDGTKTVLGLCAYEWECVGYGIADAIDHKPITPETFLGNLALCSDEEKEKYKADYHYYRWSGAIVANTQKHWLTISSAIGGLLGFFVMRGQLTN